MIESSARGMVTLAAAAEYLAVNPRTVRLWVAQDRLPAYRVGSRLVRVRLEDVEGLLREIPTC